MSAAPEESADAHKLSILVVVQAELRTILSRLLVRERSRLRSEADAQQKPVAATSPLHPRQSSPTRSSTHPTATRRPPLSELVTSVAPLPAGQRHSPRASSPRRSQAATKPQAQPCDLPWRSTELGDFYRARLSWLPSDEVMATVAEQRKDWIATMGQPQQVPAPTVPLSRPPEHLPRLTPRGGPQQHAQTSPRGAKRAPPTEERIDWSHHSNPHNYKTSSSLAASMPELRTDSHGGGDQPSQRGDGRTPAPPSRESRGHSRQSGATGEPNSRGESRTPQKKKRKELSTGVLERRKQYMRNVAVMMGGTQAFEEFETPPASAAAGDQQPQSASKQQQQQLTLSVHDALQQQNRGVFAVSTRLFAKPLDPGYEKQKWQQRLKELTDGDRSAVERKKKMTEQLQGLFRGPPRDPTPISDDGGEGGLDDDDGF